MTVSMIGKKLGEGHPNVVDLIENSSIVGLINTVTGGRVVLQDGFQIRRVATMKQIPCFISLDTIRVVWRALASSGQIFSVRPLSEYTLISD